ncbi:MAG: hypothetical protein GEU90_06175 [Gemmatimonas sp.]|nr:hypothetical protein [Gemmatimonas sp.]
MSGLTAAKLMGPIPEAVTLKSTAGEVRRRMRDEDLEFLPVVAEDTGSVGAALVSIHAVGSWPEASD